MFADVDLRKLAQMTAPERAFLSIYLDEPGSVRRLEKQFKEMRKLLTDDDERQYFDENVKMVQSYLDEKNYKKGSVCLFACWVLEYFQAIPLTATVPYMVRVDDSPYIRPLAELQDEYENVAVVVADNKRSRIFLVSSATEQDAEKVKGNVKNHVRVGGWSQQRYERRRDKQVHHYAKDIVSALVRMDQDSEFRRIIFVGGKEILQAVHERLPQSLEKKLVGEKAVDLGKGDSYVQQEIWDLFVEEERKSEERLWERIRTEVLKGGLGAAGIEGVFEAAKEGRVDKMVVTRNYTYDGTRCRACGEMSPAKVEKCPACGASSMFPVELVGEIVEMLERMGGEVDFVDPIPSLTEAGDIAALLRY